MELGDCGACCRLEDAALYFFLRIALPAACFGRRHSGPGMEGCSGGGAAEEGSSGLAGLRKGRRGKNG